jgi:hypothetical protein
MAAENSEAQQKRITVTVEPDLAEWIQRESTERRIGEATFVRMTLAAAMQAGEVAA